MSETTELERLVMFPKIVSETYGKHLKLEDIMGEIASVTFNIREDTFQVVNGVLLIWKGLPDHEPEFEIEMEDVRRLITASSYLKTET